MNYTASAQNFLQMETDMSKRRKLTPEEIALKVVKLCEADPIKPPKNATRIELLAWELAQTPSYGLQERVHRAFLKLAKEEPQRPNKKQRRKKNKKPEPA